MSRPIHCEVHADDPARAIDFYERVPGWSFKPFGAAEYLLISKGTGDAPVVNAGGSIAVPREAISGVGWPTDVRAIEGNLFGLSQPDHCAT